MVGFLNCQELGFGTELKCCVGRLIQGIFTLIITWSAYHLNEILGENFSTIGTACSVLRKRKWECAVSFARKTGCSS